MAGKLLQCLMLLCLALACYGYLRFFMRAFRLPPEFALVSFLSALALAMFTAGCLGLLLPAAYILLALGAALGLMSLLRRESLRPLFSPSMLLWLLLCALSLYLVFGQKFYYVDDFSHWATAVKTLLRNDAFPTPADKLIYFPDYPLGSSVLIYWFARMSGINSEWFQMLVQAVYISACLSLPDVAYGEIQAGNRYLVAPFLYQRKLSVLQDKPSQRYRQAHRGGRMLFGYRLGLFILVSLGDRSQ